MQTLCESMRDHQHMVESVNQQSDLLGNDGISNPEVKGQVNKLTDMYADLHKKAQVCTDS